MVGLPKNYALLDLCERKKPQALGMDPECIVERAHGIGQQNINRASPRPIIVKYLNFRDKKDILHTFCKSGALKIEGHKILIFADYSMEVSKKRRAFSTICLHLYKKGVKFTLAYPVVLYVQTPAGDREAFINPIDAERYVVDHLSNTRSMERLHVWQTATWLSPWLAETTNTNSKQEGGRRKQNKRGQEKPERKGNFEDLKDRN